MKWKRNDVTPPACCLINALKIFIVFLHLCGAVFVAPHTNLVWGFLVCAARALHHMFRDGKKEKENTHANY